MVLVPMALAGGFSCSRKAVQVVQNPIAEVPPAKPAPVRPSVEWLPAKPAPGLKTGAEQTQLYFPFLLGKRVGLVVNQTSIIGRTALVDSLVRTGIKVVRIFGPEHGFRGKAGAGVHVANEIDSATGIPVVSLYGKKHKPTAEQLADLDVLVFDIQDVGARFYTYINTLHYVMEACAEHNKMLLVLDRPNPNGFSIDGPVLEDALHSGIGMHPIPITHGLTMGEFAQMLNGEKWLKNKVQCPLQIVKLEGYTHQTRYQLPIPPSPNLNSGQAIRLYPSLCLFEGTIISLGRGTLFPFTVLGAPMLKNARLPGSSNWFTFKPAALPFMSPTPLHKDLDCFGLDLRTINPDSAMPDGQINLRWLIDLYQAYPDRAQFFDRRQSSQIGDFDKLAGTANLRRQITEGVSEEKIRDSWAPGLVKFRRIRDKYLLYP